MTTEYEVVTHGLSGQVTKAIASQRLRQLNISDAIVEKLVDHSVILKKGLPKQQADAYESKLSQAGLNVEVRTVGGASGASGLGALAGKLKDSASLLGGIKGKLKRGVEGKLKNVNIPQLSKDSDDERFDDDDSSKAYKQQLSDNAGAKHATGQWRGPHDVDKLFHSAMPKIKTPVTLPVNAFKGAGLTLLLPGIYVITLLTFVWFFISNTVSSIINFSSIITFISLFIFGNFFLLLIIGFLAKPILAFFSRPPSVEVNKHECPELFWLIGSICSKLKVVPPERIYMDMSLDMRISYIDHFKGFLHNRTRIVIGAPLTQSLSSAQFIGVLTYTLAHLKQPVGGRTHYIIRAVNNWMMMASKEDDFIDQMIEKELDKNEITVIVEMVLNGLQRVFATNRVIMEQMLNLNLKLVGKDARALDMHADHYAAVMIGSDDFEQLALDYRKVIRAFEQSEGINDQLMSKNQLLQDIPEVVGSLVKSYDSRIENLLRQDVESRLTYTWEPHPPDWERIDKASFLQASSIFFCDAELIELMPSLHNLGVKATRAFYEQKGLDLGEFSLARPKF